MKKSLVLLSSLAITLGLFLIIEIGVRVAGKEPLEWPAADNPVGLEQILADPLLGPLPRPGWRGRWMGLFDVEIDDHGFRTTGIPAPTEPAARIAFVGDSCMFGWGLDTPETLVALLDQMQRNPGPATVELINAGFQGQSAVVGERILTERVLPRDPDIVVLAFSANNAFRFSAVPHRARFSFFGIRKFLLRSRVFHILAAELAHRNSPGVHPRDRDLLAETPLRDLHRVASPGDFERAVRAIVEESRAAGAQVFFLIVPRISTVSATHKNEDVGQWPPWRRQVLKGVALEASPRERLMMELSCLEHRQLDDPVAELFRRVHDWQRVYPNSPALVDHLAKGARAYAEGDLRRAYGFFDAAMSAAPNSPLAHYDAGVTQITAGKIEEGFQHIEEADRLACNVFLHYQTILWRVAVEEQVRVVDLTLYFQQGGDAKDLYLDQAHPNARGEKLIAEVLWPVLMEQVRDTRKSAAD